MSERLATGFTVQGWCPSSWRPMRAQDGWLVRVRPVCASIRVAQWQRLAELAQAHAHPQLELTRLGNVQLRGVADAALDALRTALIEAGLAPADPELDDAPAVLCSPFYDAGDDTHRLALALMRAVQQAFRVSLLMAQGIPALPSKFSCLVDDPGRHLRRVAADLRLWPASAQRVALAWGHHTHLVGSPEQAVAAAVALATRFAAERQHQQPVPTRLAQWLEVPGDAIAASAQAPGSRASGGDAPNRTANRASSGTPSRDGFTDHPPASLASAHAATACHSQVADQPFTAPSPGRHAVGWLLGAPLGRVDLAALRALCQQLPAAAELRVTPWRSLFLPAAQAPAQLVLGDAWISTAQDARLRVSACTGAPRCTQGHAPTQALALRLATQVPAGVHVHVSGCAKHCALPAEADALLVAEPARADQPPNTARWQARLLNAGGRLAPSALEHLLRTTHAA